MKVKKAAKKSPQKGTSTQHPHTTLVDGLSDLTRVMENTLQSLRDLDVKHDVQDLLTDNEPEENKGKNINYLKSLSEMVEYAQKGLSILRDKMLNKETGKLSIIGNGAVDLLSQIKKLADQIFNFTAFLPTNEALTDYTDNHRDVKLVILSDAHYYAMGMLAQFVGIVEKVYPSGDTLFELVYDKDKAAFTVIRTFLNAGKQTNAKYVQSCIETYRCLTAIFKRYQETHPSVKSLPTEFMLKDTGLMDGLEAGADDGFVNFGVTTEEEAEPSRVEHSSEGDTSLSPTKPEETKEELKVDEEERAEKQPEPAEPQPVEPNGAEKPKPKEIYKIPESAKMIMYLLEGSKFTFSQAKHTQLNHRQVARTQVEQLSEISTHEKLVTQRTDQLAEMREKVIEYRECITNLTTEYQRFLKQVGPDWKDIPGQVDVAKLDEFFKNEKLSYDEIIALCDFVDSEKAQVIKSNANVILKEKAFVLDNFHEMIKEKQWKDSVEDYKQLEDTLKPLEFKYGDLLTFLRDIRTNQKEENLTSLVAHMKLEQYEDVFKSEVEALQDLVKDENKIVLKEEEDLSTSKKRSFLKKLKSADLKKPTEMPEVKVIDETKLTQVLATINDKSSELMQTHFADLHGQLKEILIKENEDLQKNCQSLREEPNKLTASDDVLVKQATWAERSLGNLQTLATKFDEIQSHIEAQEPVALITKEFEKAKNELDTLMQDFYGWLMWFIDLMARAFRVKMEKRPAAIQYYYMANELKTKMEESYQETLAKVNDTEFKPEDGKTLEQAKIDFVAEWKTKVEETKNHIVELTTEEKYLEAGVFFDAKEACEKLHEIAEGVVVDASPAA